MQFCQSRGQVYGFWAQEIQCKQRNSFELTDIISRYLLPVYVTYYCITDTRAVKRHYKPLIFAAGEAVKKRNRISKRVSQKLSYNFQQLFCQKPCQPLIHFIKINVTCFLILIFVINFSCGRSYDCEQRWNWRYRVLLHWWCSWCNTYVQNNCCRWRIYFSLVWWWYVIM